MAASLRRFADANWSESDPQSDSPVSSESVEKESASLGSALSGLRSSLLGLSHLARVSADACRARFLRGRLAFSDMRWERRCRTISQSTSAMSASTPATNAGYRRCSSANCCCIHGGGEELGILAQRAQAMAEAAFHNRTRR